MSSNNNAYIPPDYFPWLGCSGIFIAMFSHAYSVTSLFAYVGYMASDLMHTDTDNAGWYASIISCAFMFGRFLSSWTWGKVVDERGRKFVLYFGLIAISILSICFGFSFNIYWAVSMRFLLGLCNGIAIAGKVLAAEIAAPKYEAKSVGLILSAWASGFIFGASIGGLLAQPADKYPSLFSQHGIFGQFPYLLPNLVPTVLSGIGLIICYNWVPETIILNNNNKNKNKNKNNMKYNKIEFDEKIDLEKSIEIEDDEEDNDDEIEIELYNKNNNNNKKYSKNLSIRDHWRNISSSKGAVIILIIYTIFSYMTMTYDEVFPLWAITSIRNGGFSLSTTEVGKILALNGIITLPYQIFIFPRIMKHISAENLFRISILLMPLFYLGIPFLSNLIDIKSDDDILYNDDITYYDDISFNNNTSNSTSNSTFSYYSFYLNQRYLENDNIDDDDDLRGNLNTSHYILFIFVSALLRVITASGFSNLVMLTNNSVPKSQRGSMNGLSTTVASLAKSLGPLFGGIMYAWSINNNINFWLFSYLFTFILLAFLSIIIAYLSIYHMPHVTNFEEKSNDEIELSKLDNNKKKKYKNKITEILKRKKGYDRLINEESKLEDSDDIIYDSKFESNSEIIHINEFNADEYDDDDEVEVFNILNHQK